VQGHVYPVKLITNIKQVKGDRQYESSLQIPGRCKRRWQELKEQHNDVLDNNCT
jgi:phage terminase Nu1 subunit (DNA packaging protein)